MTVSPARPPLGRPNSRCSRCGTPFAEADLPNPYRVCPGCTAESWINPLPVTALLVPHGLGLVGIRRKVPGDGEGKLALPGGFVVKGETWRVAGAREAKEEANLDVDPAQVTLFGLEDALDANVLLLFGLAPRIEGDLPPFVPNDEVYERVLLDGTEELAFSLHTEAMRRWFAGQRT